MIPAIRWSPGIRWSPAIRWSPGIRWSIRSMDFDNRKVYGDTSITDGLLLHSRQKCRFLKFVNKTWQFLIHDLDGEGGNKEKIRKSLSISSSFPHYLSIFSQPGCQDATICATLINTIIIIILIIIIITSISNFLPLPLGPVVCWDLNDSMSAKRQSRLETAEDPELIND